MIMKLKKVLLIDDDDTVNFINRRLIEKSAIADKIVSKTSALEALDILTNEAEKGGGHSN